jgi:hypothetical protein
MFQSAERRAVLDSRALEARLFLAAAMAGCRAVGAILMYGVPALAGRAGFFFDARQEFVVNRLA